MARLQTQSLDHFTDQIGATSRGFPVYRVTVPQPPYANKGYMVERKGLYVLEETPGMLVAVACTHFGEGQVRVLDGKVDAWKGVILPGARPLYVATSQTMCLWMMSAGFSEGLVVETIGTDRAQPVFLSVSWSVPKGAVNAAA